MTRKFKYLIPAIAIVLMGAAFQYGGLKLDITSQVSSVSPIVLSSASTQIQRVTGSANQVVKLPDATTLRAGYFYYLSNEGSGTLTISNSASTQIVQLAAGNTATQGAFLFLTSSATTGGPWTYGTLGGSGGGGSGTVGNVTTFTPSLTATTTNPTLGTNTFIASYYRTGQIANLSYTLTQTSAGAGAGSGAYLLNIPPTLTIDTTNLILNSSITATTFGGGTQVGTCFASNTNTNGVTNPMGILFAYSSTQLVCLLVSGSGTLNAASPWGSNALTTTNTVLNFTAIARVPISGW